MVTISYYHRENEAEHILKNENKLKKQLAINSPLTVNTIHNKSKNFNHTFICTYVIL